MVALWVQRCLKTHGFPSHVSTIMLAPSCRKQHLPSLMAEAMKLMDFPLANGC